MSGKKGASLSILTMVIILAATEITLDKLGKSAIAQGQENITEEQKAAMCDPSNPKLKFVNGTESRICGIPKTLHQQQQIQQQRQEQKHHHLRLL